MADAWLPSPAITDAPMPSPVIFIRFMINTRLKFTHTHKHTHINTHTHIYRRLAQNYDFYLTMAKIN